MATQIVCGSCKGFLTEKIRVRVTTNSGDRELYCPSCFKKSAIPNGILVSCRMLELQNTQLLFIGQKIDCSRCKNQAEVCAKAINFSTGASFMSCRACALKVVGIHIEKEVGSAPKPQLRDNEGKIIMPTGDLPPDMIDCTPLKENIHLKFSRDEAEAFLNGKETMSFIIRQREKKSRRAKEHDQQFVVSFIDKTENLQHSVITWDGLEKVYTMEGNPQKYSTLVHLLMRYKFLSKTQIIVTKKNKLRENTAQLNQNLVTALTKQEPSNVIDGVAINVIPQQQPDANTIQRQVMYSQLPEQQQQSSLATAQQPQQSSLAASFDSASSTTPLPSNDTPSSSNTTPPSSSLSASFDNGQAVYASFSKVGAKPVRYDQTLPRQRAAPQLQYIDLPPDSNESSFAPVQSELQRSLSPTLFTPPTQRRMVGLPSQAPAQSSLLSSDSPVQSPHNPRRAVEPVNALPTEHYQSANELLQTTTMARQQQQSPQQQQQQQPQQQPQQSQPIAMEQPRMYSTQPEPAPTSLINAPYYSQSPPKRSPGMDAFGFPMFANGSVDPTQSKQQQQQQPVQQQQPIQQQQQQFRPIRALSPQPTQQFQTQQPAQQQQQQQFSTQQVQQPVQQQFAAQAQPLQQQFSTQVQQQPMQQQFSTQQVQQQQQQQQQPIQQQQFATLQQPTQQQFSSQQQQQQQTFQPQQPTQQIQQLPQQQQQQPLHQSFQSQSAQTSAAAPAASSNDTSELAPDLDPARAPWYHRNVSTKQAIALLNGKEPLSFLVRRSRYPGSYAITVADRGGGVRHTLIKPVENGQGYLFAGQKDDMPFDDIPELVKFLIRSKALGTPVLP